LYGAAIVTPSAGSTAVTDAATDGDGTGLGDGLGLGLGLGLGDGDAATDGDGVATVAGLALPPQAPTTSASVNVTAAADTR
jgi:hypothetical protein